MSHGVERCVSVTRADGMQNEAIAGSLGYSAIPALIFQVS